MSQVCGTGVNCPRRQAYCLTKLGHKIRNLIQSIAVVGGPNLDGQLQDLLPFQERRLPPLLFTLACAQICQ